MWRARAQVVAAPPYLAVGSHAVASVPTGIILTPPLRVTYTYNGTYVRDKFKVKKAEHVLID